MNEIRFRTKPLGVDLCWVQKYIWGRLSLDPELGRRIKGSGLNHMGLTYINLRTNSPGVD